MKRRKRDAELIDVILSDCETLTKRIATILALRRVPLFAIEAMKANLPTTQS